MEDRGDSRGPILHDLPDSLLLRVLRRVSASAPAGPLHFSLVCRRWSSLRSRAAVLLVRRNRRMPGQDLARQLRQFQGPTRLILRTHSVKGLRALWLGLAEQGGPGTTDPNQPGSPSQGPRLGLAKQKQGPRLTSIVIEEPSDCCEMTPGGNHTPSCSRWQGCEGEMSELCAKNGEACAWWAFSGPFLGSNPRALRSLRVKEAEHGKAVCVFFKDWRHPPSEACRAFYRNPSPAVALDELSARLGGLKRLSLETVNLCWPRDWPAALPLLRSLEIKDELEYAFPPSLSRMTGLTELRLKQDNSRGPDFTGMHHRLRRLKWECPYIEELPESLWTLTGLRSLDLELQEANIPEGITKLICLRELRLESYHVRFPAEHVAVLGRQGLSALAFAMPFDDQPPGFGASLTAVKELSINPRGHPLPNLMPLLPALSGLERLSLECFPLPALPCGLVALTSLKELALKNVGELQKLPEGFGSLVNLERLSLVNLENFKGFPRDLGRLSGLQGVTLSDLPALHGLPGSLCDLPSLKRLLLSCLKVQRLPPEIGRLPLLTELT